jgi:hypothetical protein
MISAPVLVQTYGHGRSFQGRAMPGRTSLQRGDAAMDSEADESVGDIGEDPFDQVEPLRAGPREVHMEAGVAKQPSKHPTAVAPHCWTPRAHAG